MELRSGRRLRSWPAPQAGRSPTRSQGSSRGDAEDRIDALPDDLLLLIIARLGCPRAAARTGILSSRWRGLWTCIPSVTVAVKGIDLGELEAALARAACAGLHLLDISIGDGDKITAYQVAAALAAADRLSPVELRFRVCQRIRSSSSGVYLPRFSRATSIELHWLRDLTPAASGLPAVERLSLSSDHSLRLANLIPRCPSLRVLDLRLDSDSDSLDGGTRIHSTSVEELHVTTLGGYHRIIDIVAPMLKQLELTLDTYFDGEMVAISIWAPVMEKLSWCCLYYEYSVPVCNGWWLYGSLDLRAVQRGTIPFNWENDTCLHLPIFASRNDRPPAEQDLAEEIRRIENTFPAFEFSTLKLDVNLWKTGHIVGPLVLSIFGINWIRKVARRLEIIVERRNIEQWCTRGTNCPCDKPENWRTKPISSTLINLEEVQVKGFVGLDDEFDFLKVIFEFALKLKKVNLKVSDKVTPCALKKIDDMFKEYPHVECCVTRLTED